ncbi:LexA family protein [Sphingomonas sp. TX0522]|uniref:LexA family protein n=1 Tax=Sphingomonas sp. TX0522 TaxID=2479205 RepID=UPI0018E016A6
MTPQQLRALDFVRDRITEAGWSPTIRELGGHLGLGSSATYRLIERLGAAGHLVLKRNTARGLSLPDMPDLRVVGSSALRAELARRGETLEGLGARPIAYGTKRTCAADTCGASVNEGHLFCLTHWRAIPVDLRSSILAAHRRRDRDQLQTLVAQARDIADGCGGVRFA